MEAFNQYLSSYSTHEERTQFQDMLLSSRFEMGDELQLPDHNLNFSSDIIVDNLLDVSDFLLDSTPELDTVSMLLGHTREAHGHHHANTNHIISSEGVLAQTVPVGFCIEDGYGDPPVVAEPTFQCGTSPTSMLTTRSWPETSSLDMTINMSSPVVGSGDEDEDEEEVHFHISRVLSKATTMNSKNLVSERNRRKRLSQQLLSLRSLVPNITKMDKRSVLVDALAYLRSIHEEITCIEEELNGRTGNGCHASLQSGSGHKVGAAQPGNISRPKGEIIQIKIEKMEEKRFVVKMTCKGGAGIGGEVLHMIEAIMNMEITYIALEEIQSQIYVTTIFIKARKQDKMTEEKIKSCITSTAMRSGLLVPVRGRDSRA